MRGNKHKYFNVCPTNYKNPFSTSAGMVSIQVRISSTIPTFIKSGFNKFYVKNHSSNSTSGGKRPDNRFDKSYPVISTYQKLFMNYNTGDKE
jgi:hypothetical protein